MPVCARAAVRPDTELRRGHAPARSFLDFETGSCIQASERIEHSRGRRTGVDESADGHIAANSRKCVQITDLHDSNCGKISAAGPRSDASTKGESGVSAMLISTTFAPADFARFANPAAGDRKSTRLNSSHGYISYAVFCL